MIESPYFDTCIFLTIKNKKKNETSHTVHKNIVQLHEELYYQRQNQKEGEDNGAKRIIPAVARPLSNQLGAPDVRSDGIKDKKQCHGQKNDGIDVRLACRVSNCREGRGEEGGEGMHGKTNPPSK